MAAGVALRQIGWSVSVYERAGDLHPVGAGFSLWANAVYALGRLGLQGQLVTLLPPSAGDGALDPDAIRLGQLCMQVEQTSQGVTAHFADSSVAHGNALISVYGIRSLMRRQLFDDSEPTYAGYTSYRGVVAWDCSSIRHGEYWRRGARFGVAL